MVDDLGWASQSKIRCYALCPKMFHFSENLRLEPKARKKCLQRGSLIALGLEHLRLEKDAKKAIDEADAGEDAEEVKDLALNVCLRAHEEITEAGWTTFYAADNTPMVEHKMRLALPIGPWRGIQGTLDWIAVDTEGRPWLWDDKSRVQTKSYGFDRRQIQAPLYQWLLDETLGLHTVGSVTSQILAAKETFPKILRDGSVSKAKPRCRKRTYLKVLQDHGVEDVGLYQHVTDRLPEKLDSIHRYYRREKEKKNIAETFQRWMHRIAADTEFLPLERPEVCSQCSYEQVCAAEQAGLYTIAKDIMNEEFTAKEIEHG